MKTLKELLEERGQLHENANEILELARAESRDITVGEMGKHNDLMDQIEGMSRTIEALLRHQRVVVDEPTFHGTTLDGIPRDAPEPPLDHDRTARTARDAPPVRATDPKSGRATFMFGPEQRFMDLPERKFNGIDVRELSLGRYLLARARKSWEGAAAEKRAMSETVNTLGGNLVPDQLWRSIVDKARALSVCYRGGMRTIPMSTDHLILPRLATDATFSQVGENQTITASDPTLGALTFTARKIACLVKASRELADDAATVFVQEIEGQIAKALAIELDRLCLVGTGGDEMLGITNNPDITTTDAAVGAISWTDLLDTIESVQNANAEANAYVVPPAVSTYLNKLLINSETEHYAPAPEDVAALTKLRTTNMSAGELLVGDFTQLILGIRNNATFEVSTEGEAFERHQIWIKCVFRGDVNCLHADHFAILKGITS